MDNYNLLSLEEVAVEVLKTAKTEMTFAEIFAKVAELKGLTDEEKKNVIAQFYTDITSSGDFLYCGDDKWDLKSNQPLSALDSEFYSEHTSVAGDDEEKDDEEKPKAKKAPRKRAKKYIEEIEDAAEDKADDEKETDDEDYENVAPADEEAEDEDEDIDNDSTDHDDKDEDEDEDDDKSEDDDEDDDFDEDKYNNIMDQYEDQY